MILLIVNIALFVVGLLLVVLSFITYQRSSEAEISQDVFITPRFIIGVVMLIAAVIMGIVTR